MHPLAAGLTGPTAARVQPAARGWPYATMPQPWRQLMNDDVTSAHRAMFADLEHMAPDPDCALARAEISVQT